MDDRKTMRLRYAGRCRACDAKIDRGVTAVYEKGSRTVLCLPCNGSRVVQDNVTATPPDAATDAAAEAAAVGDAVLVDGQAGASARREHARRAAKRENKIRADHPRLGGLILALTDEPQSTTAWARGALGEERLGRRLDSSASPLIRVLHDRRIPRTKANIDHIVVCPSGVVVIDAKRYQGRPTLRIEGGILRPRVERLLVGRRDCTKLVDGVLKQVALVVAALANPAECAHEPGSTVPPAAVPVTGMLCFVDADWPLIGGAFTTREVQVMWPKKAGVFIQQPGALAVGDVERLTRAVAAAFPPA